MSQGLRSIVAITILTFTSQVLLFVVQIVTAALFGTSKEMDAFLAASALPQYIVSVLFGSIGFVLIPLYLESQSTGNPQRAKQLTACVFTLTLLLVGAISVLGILFIRPILRITTPGLDHQTLDLAASVAIPIWPALLATGPLSVLTSVYQANKKFKWQAAVPVIGSAIHLTLLIFLTKQLGIFALAIASAASTIGQILLMVNIVYSRDLLKFLYCFRNRDLRQLYLLTFPLFFVALATKITPVFERFLASDLAPGTISYLNYAFKIATALFILISTGLTTVAFPRMSSVLSSGSLSLLGTTFSSSLRMMALITLPVVSIGIPLSESVVRLLFERGEFTQSDSIVVSNILQMYLVGVLGMCLGNITGKVFYVLQKTRILSIFGIFEILAYLGYTYLLTKWLGAIGLALGFALYYLGSVVWHLVTLNRSLRLDMARELGGPILVMTIAGFVSGLAGYFATLATPTAALQLSFAGPLGLVVYVFLLYLLRSEDLKTAGRLLISTITNR